MIKKTLLLMMMIFGLAACETVAGFERDVRSVTNDL